MELKEVTASTITNIQQRSVTAFIVLLEDS